MAVTIRSPGCAPCGADTLRLVVDSDAYVDVAADPRALLAADAVPGSTASSAIAMRIANRHAVLTLEVDIHPPWLSRLLTASTADPNRGSGAAQDQFCGGVSRPSRSRTRRSTTSRCRPSPRARHARRARSPRRRGTGPASAEASRPGTPAGR